MRAAAGAISRARAGARAHLYITPIYVFPLTLIPDLLEAAEI